MYLCSHFYVYCVKMVCSSLKIYYCTREMDYTITIGSNRLCYWAQCKAEDIYQIIEK